MKLALAIREFVDHKRTLGHIYTGEANRLRMFLDQAGNIELELISSQQIKSFLDGKDGDRATSYWFAKYDTLRVFFRYAISRGYLHQSLLPTTLPQTPSKFIPYIYTVEEIRRLLRVPDSCYSPSSILTPATMRTLLLLLYSTGLRIGEVAKLRVSDVNLAEALLTVRETKFFKSRFVPISQDLVQQLTIHRDQQCPKQQPDPSSPFFYSRGGNPMIPDHANRMFQWLRTEAGVLRMDESRYQPRLHDFRHTFAVMRLVAWYKEKKDVQRLLPLLSTYLGHIHIDSTAHYLSMTQDLLHEASLCFERYALGGHHD